MEKPLSQFNWRIALGKKVIDAIDEEFILLEKSIKTPISKEPFKADVSTVVLCTRGKMEGAIDLKPFKIEAPALVVVLPDQILEQKYISEDFTGSIIVMSKQFTENLLPNVQDRLSLSLTVRENPYRPLNSDSLIGMKNYFDTIRDVIQFKENPNRLEAVRYLMLAFFYGVGFMFQPKTDNKDKTHYEMLVENYIRLVQKHYKKERLLSFYANELCLTPKHLSKVIKETSGKTANNWIDDYVILEAKALLKSTNMTVQQICDELNFDCQSFFGKYFKRHTGMSPREYKGK